MQAVVAAGAGFLLAVLWFDLMFDAQVARQPPGELPESVLVSITAYYRRVTTEARPMNRLVAAAMAGTTTAIVVQLIRHDAPRWVSAVSALCAITPIGLAAGRTVPAAVRLGARRDATTGQSALARTIWRDHLFCVTAIAALLTVQLVWG